MLVILATIDCSYFSHRLDLISILVIASLDLVHLHA